MISVTAFNVLVVLAWLAKFSFGAVIIYWFVTQGLSDPESATVASPHAQAESSRSVRISLAAWVAFFIVIVAMIVPAS
ncbi:hypothetical protein MBEHAL_0600 [Halarchaeum acidiphilum MH1-52-1]|uniref:Uncharacterized protein n=1 Tax=Halarchaeum acidiphilum MH1-52-1 TaxID=1261545 RepID=U2YS82_9EURY|nr:hypothetical protein [Halarchaeum acidiphilum]GAD51840.1 hypothetical protein MBEHAL_0600 [Halarchaeum acidiphilum MH1-52-1]